MVNKLFRFLEWDTNIFGHKVAKIIPEKLPTNVLRDLLISLREESFELIFWAASPEMSRKEITNLGASLINQRIEYKKDLSQVQAEEADPDFRLVSDPEQIDKVLDLAILAGKFSRFNMDPRIEKRIFLEIESNWIKNSLAKENEEVWIIEKDNKTASMITLPLHENYGDIGLISTSEDYQKKGLASKMIKHAFNRYLLKGITEAKVVTQTENIAACGLYEKFGYKCDKVLDYYHFWL